MKENAHIRMEMKTLGIFWRAHFGTDRSAAYKRFCLNFGCS